MTSYKYLSQKIHLVTVEKQIKKSIYFNDRQKGLKTLLILCKIFLWPLTKNKIQKVNSNLSVEI